MAERAKSVLIDLGDGVKREFRWTLNNFIELQKAVGLGITQMPAILAKMDKDVSILRTLLFLGLRKGSPDLTEEAIGDLLGMDNFLEVGLQVVAYIRGAAGLTDDDLKNVDWAAAMETLRQLSGTGTPPSTPGSGPA